jgi:drug/metabolite transporter (DMT)-like permease
MGTLAISLPILLVKRAEWRQQPALMLAIMLSSGWCNTAFILAIIDGEIMRVILLFYLSPLWSTLLARILLKEQLSARAYATLALAALGALLILWEPRMGMPWPGSSADWLAISAGIAFAFTNLFTHMAGQTSIKTKTVAAWLGVILISGGALLLGDHQIALSNTTGIMMALLIGLLMMSVMTFAVVYGVTHLPVHRSAIILLFQVVVAAISSYLLTEERMAWYEWLGGIIVIVAAYLAITQQSHRPQT